MFEDFLCVYQNTLTFDNKLGGYVTSNATSNDSLLLLFLLYEVDHACHYYAMLPQLSVSLQQ